MPRSRNHIAGKLLLAVALSAVWVAVGTTPASALAGPVDCGELQSTIDEVVSQKPDRGDGETIVLNGLCEGSEVTLPAGANLSIEGEQGTKSGFDGTGSSGPLLETIGTEEAGAITLANLTFERANLTGASALSIRAARVTLAQDSFREDDERGEGAHAAFVSVGQSPVTCPPESGPPAIAVIDSTFSDNKLALLSSPGGGAGAWLQDTCEHSLNVLEGDIFEGNVLEADGTPEGTEVTGAGLRFLGGHEPATVSQSADVFDSNEIVAPPSDVGNYAGGGEWLENASLLSVGDRFSRNTIAGTSSGSYDSWSWGAGLAISNLTYACSQPAFPESTLENSVLEGNAIGPGTEADLGGGGVWVGCTHLRVLDSTVTLNSAPIGSGIEGEPQDQLEVANSIVAQNSPGSEIAGFQGEPSSLLSTSYSDACSMSNVPLEGAGNICANPLLADNGDPTSFDVQETELSPTIDAGSNALVPGALTSDFYGNQRILSGRAYTPSCTSTSAEAVIPVLDPPVVDMGASEYGPIAVPATAVLCKEAPGPQTPQAPQSPTNPGQPAKPSPEGPGASPAFALSSLVQQADGELALTFMVREGRLRVSGSFKLIDSVVRKLKGRHRSMRKREKTLTYGQATLTVRAQGERTLYLKPTKEARKLLAHSGRLAVALSMTFTGAGTAPTTRYKTITVIYRRQRAR